MKYTFEYFLVNLPIESESPFKVDFPFSTYSAIRSKPNPDYPDLKSIVDGSKKDPKFPNHEMKINYEENSASDENLAGFDSNYFQKAVVPRNLKSSLTDYQLQSHQWCLYREKCISQKQLFVSDSKFYYKNPLFQKHKFLNGESFFFNSFTGQILTSPPQDTCQGGILADEMGLGKTVSIIALVVGNPYKKERMHSTQNFVENQDKKKKIKTNDGTDSLISPARSVMSIEDADEILSKRTDNNENSSGKMKKAGTLIIVPSTLLDQWSSELNLHTKNGTIELYRYKTNKDLSNLPSFDVVLTTYNVVLAECKSGEPGLKDLKWFRVVLDEAHKIKNEKAKTHEAVCSLNAINRWCLTGTPIHNCYEDLFSLLKFIRFKPWDDHEIWSKFINQASNPSEIIKEVIRPVILRRLKESEDLEGNRLNELPDLHINTIKVALSTKQMEIYNLFFDRAHDHYQYFINHSQPRPLHLNHEFLGITFKIRLLCNHLRLFFKKEQLASIETIKQAIEEYFCNLKSSKQMEKQALPISPIRERNNQNCCEECKNELKSYAVLPCGHTLCKDCIEICDDLCPVDDCFTFFEFSELRFEENQEETSDDSNSFQVLYDGLGSKLESVLQNLYQIQARNEKVVIFTHMLNMMDIIGACLNKEKINYIRLDGHSKGDRHSRIQDFTKNQSMTVLLSSIKSGSEGLNLTAANNVIIFDQWWNPMLEEQAIARVHRKGQEKEVHVYKYYAGETVEERILDISHQKREMSKNLFAGKTIKEKKKIIQSQSQMIMSQIMLKYEHSSQDDDKQSRIPVLLSKEQQALLE